MTVFIRRLSLSAIAFAASTAPAFAHHPLNGQPMSTFTDGLLSGVGHPVLGFDHLFFVVAMGILAAFSGRAFAGPMAYVAGMLGGVALILGGIALPMVEAMIALSLVIVGGILMLERKLNFGTAAVLFAALGLFHGWAFGEALAGVEASAATGVTLGYLLGLAAVQWAVAVAAGALVMRGAEAVPARLAGAMAAGVGVFLTLEALEGAAFAALGIL